MADPVWVVGDPQGWVSALEAVLASCDLIDPASQWTGGDATLTVCGDLVDRGPDGIGVIDLLMRLQLESGGRVQVVIGNHDVQLLAARRFGGDLFDEWIATGGLESDLGGLGDVHVEWLSTLPAMVMLDDVVAQHADAMFYREYGSTIDAVNEAIRDVLRGDDAAEWRQLLDRFGEHRAFFGADGQANLSEFLQTFGGSRLVHGHTPIARMLGVAPESVTEAYVYCGGACVNVDPGIYLGGPGFAYRLR